MKLDPAKVEEVAKRIFETGRVAQEAANPEILFEREWDEMKSGYREGYRAIARWHLRETGKVRL